jgi:redox-sensitive bicupin YhaK (pirin superfamily)
MSNHADRQTIATRDSVLGEGMPIRRALPARQKRTVGAWCFLDHFGPQDVTHGKGMRVGPHPHIGLQTFTWPIAGEILHRDSLGSEQIIRPGQINLMTAGRGIAHSEESPVERSPLMHGAQLWIALPESHRHIEPAFEHFPDIPGFHRGGLQVTVLTGEMLGERSPVQLYTPSIGIDVHSPQGGEARLPLRPDFEHAVLMLDAAAQIDGEALAIGTLLVLPPGRDHIDIRSNGPMRLLLIGGEPFPEEPLLWWNFVARTQDEITQATQDWNAGVGFGEVHGYDGERLIAPPPPWMS